ncbi:MAG: hypothetical protein HY746_07955 [Elusimicrobia bacterium]|nr:hypothetical protein [Elusimicrobiota bacterium]
MRNILAVIVFLFFNSSLYAAGSEPSEILKLSYREIFLNQDRAWTGQNVAGNNFDFIMGFAPELNIKIRSERSRDTKSVLLKDIGAGKDVYFDSLVYKLLYENGIIRMYLPNWVGETTMWCPTGLAVGRGDWGDGQAYLNSVELIRTANNLAIRVLLYSDEYSVLIEDFERTRYVVLLKNDLYGRITVFRFKEEDLNKIVWFDKSGPFEFGILKRGENLVFYQR